MTGHIRGCLHHTVRWTSHVRRRTSHGSRSSHRWSHTGSHSNSSAWTCQTWRWLIHHRRDLYSPAHRLSTTHATHLCTFSNSPTSLSRRSFSTHCDNIITPQQNETKGTFHLPLLIFGLLWLDLSELLSISQYQIHVLVKCNKRSHQGTRVLNGNSDSIINPLQKLTTSRHIFSIL